MKHYILFTEKELDDMIHGEEIEHRLSNGETVYFMCNEHFIKNEPDITIVCDENDINSLIFNTFDEAMDILNKLKESINQYEIVLLSDLYELIGLTANYIDTKYGWISLEKANIVECDNGYELKLPRALPIE